MSAAATDTVAQTVVTVTVQVNDLGRIRCVPHLAVVAGTDALITFNLDGAGWAFPDTDAVVVTDGADQFPIPAWTIHPTQVALLDSNTAPGAFSYTVSVQSTATGERCSMDPGIKNEA